LLEGINLNRTILIKKPTDYACGSFLIINVVLLTLH
jgi:hypothetical protein